IQNVTTRVKCFGFLIFPPRFGVNISITEYISVGPCGPGGPPPCSVVYQTDLLTPPPIQTSVVQIQPPTVVHQTPNNSFAMNQLGTVYATKRRRRNGKSLKPPPKDGVTKSNPSKRHRERLNAELDTLANLLPFEQNILSKLDRLSILRLSVSYLRTKSYFQVTMHKIKEENQYRSRGEVSLYEQAFTDGDMFLQALNGFLVILTCEGEVFFATHTIESYLGFHQYQPYTVSNGFSLPTYEVNKSNDCDKLYCHQTLTADQNSKGYSSPYITLPLCSDLPQSHKLPSKSLNSKSLDGLSSNDSSPVPSNHLVTPKVEDIKSESFNYSEVPRQTVLMWGSNPSRSPPASPILPNGHINYPSQEIKKYNGDPLKSLAEMNTIGENKWKESPPVVSPKSYYQSYNENGPSERLDIRGRIKILHGQNRKLEEPPLALFAICTPFGPPSLLEIPHKEVMFKSKHKLDLSLVSMDQRGKMLLGYSDTELANMGGYDLVHYDDLAYVASAHQELLKTGASGMIAYRFQTNDGGWQWLQTSSRLVYKNSKPDFVISTHRPLMEEEGRDLLGKRTMDFKVSYLDAGLNNSYFSDSDQLTPSHQTLAPSPGSAQSGSSSTTPQRVNRRYKTQLRDFLSTCRTKRKMSAQHAAPPPPTPAPPIEYLTPPDAVAAAYSNMYTTGYSATTPEYMSQSLYDNRLPYENLFHQYRPYYPEYQPYTVSNGFSLPTYEVNKSNDCDKLYCHQTLTADQNSKGYSSPFEVFFGSVIGIRGALVWTME
ncbi:uncharacterized protein LOC103507474, partial [Diaphorina citri]|uniref:Uncharacterized protein LOC103507474 n=1 Tax=Diaphorina citri TaxID=121845 RepID=A0A1S4E9K0_DIACI